MKKLFYISVLLLFCSSAVLAQKALLETHSKVYSSNFVVKAKDILSVKTCYSKVIISEWDKNEINLSTTVTLRKGTSDDFIRLLNYLTITSKQSSKGVSHYSALSYCDDRKMDKIKDEMEIVLEVKMPRSVFIELDTRYGNIEMETIYNDFNAIVSYGNLNAESLLGNNNNIEVKYGNITLNQLLGNVNVIDVKYGKFNIKQVKNSLTLTSKYTQGTINDVALLKLDSKYCTIKLNSVKTLSLTSGYDKISVQKSMEKIEGDMKYGTLTIASLKTSCVLNPFSYSKITIEEVLSSFTHISITDAAYSNIFLSIPREESFAFDYSGRYTDFKDKNIRLNDATFNSDNYTTEMQGIYGKNNASGKKVKISARYGSVSLFER